MTEPSNEAYHYALQALMNDGVIAYPTEAVYGFGCNPFSKKAVEKLLAIKDRPVYKGLILIAGEFAQIEPLLQFLTTEITEKVWATWPGPVSWAWPKTDLVPDYIYGDWDSVVVRLTAHPIAKQLCLDFGGPLVSTSANRANDPPCRTFAEVEKQFARELEYIVPGEVGGLDKPTEIRDVMTGDRLR